MEVIIIMDHIMHIKTTMTHCFTLPRMTIIKKTDNNNCQGCGKLDLSYIAVRKVNGATPKDYSPPVPQKVKHSNYTTKQFHSWKN